MSLVLPSGWRNSRFLLAAALCALTTLGTLPLRDFLNAANIVMLFLLTVFVVAVWLGRGPSILATFLSVALFDFFFVLPHLSFAVADAQYVVTFAVMLAVGLITSHLTARLADRTNEAQARERDTRVLYELARDLGGAMSLAQVADITQCFLGDMRLDVTILVAESSTPGAVFHQVGKRHLSGLEHGFVRSAYEGNTIVETDSLVGMGVAIVFLPLNGPTQVRGVLAIGSSTGDVDSIRSLRPLLEAVASLVAVILDRLHYADAARESELQVTAERLRTSSLSSLSHDLRTPLTSLVGLSDSLAQAQPPLPEGASETAGIIRDQAHAMHHLLSNLLEMARLKAGNIILNREWQPFEEIVGSSTRLLAGILASHKLEIDAPPDLPLLYFDAILLERVMCNLLENAAKYSPDDARIQLIARVRETSFDVDVCNDGAGFPPDRLNQVFDLFVRGERELAVAGTGMGLAICKAIIAAHGGTIAAENRTGGACVRFTLADQRAAWLAVVA
jgi:two-component system sensor histidine kinase KdpD